MNPALRSLVNRFKEPSSWAGFAVLFAVFGVPATTYQLVANVGAGLAGLLAIALPESAKE